MRLVQITRNWRDDYRVVVVAEQDIVDIVDIDIYNYHTYILCLLNFKSPSWSVLCCIDKQ